MRRKNREITEFTEIIEVLDRCETIRLGIRGEEYPYVVPLSFGYEVCGGKVVLYFHGAKEGLKHDLLAGNNKICVEADRFFRYEDTPGGVTTVYESVIGFGTAEKVYGEGAVHGLDLLLAHCGYDGYVYNHKEAQIAQVYKIALDSITGKRQAGMQ